MSQEIAAEFKNQEKADSGLAVTVLTLSHWPTYQSCDVLLPAQLSQALDGFRDFYVKKHNGRKLVWQTCLCTCTVKATGAWKKELIVSLLQALVLLIFNGEEEVTFQTIKQKVGTTDQELVRAVQHMTFAQVCAGSDTFVPLNNTLQQNRILKRRTTVKGSKDLLDTDLFRVNNEFQHKNYRVRLNMIMRDTDQETKVTTEKVFTDRQHSVDACIVRTMKSRKTVCLLSKLTNTLNIHSHHSSLTLN